MSGPFLKTVWVVDVKVESLKDAATWEWLETTGGPFATQADARDWAGIDDEDDGKEMRTRGIFADDPEARASHEAAQRAACEAAEDKARREREARRPYECGMPADCGATCALPKGHHPNIEHTCRTDGEECPA